MISRRVIRIKTLQELYAFYASSDKSLNNAEKELFFSLQKTYDLYHLLLQLPIEVQKYAKYRIDLNMRKLRPTEEDLNPNLRFAKNGIINKIAENSALANYLEAGKLSWINQEDMVKKLYRIMVETDMYGKYMNQQEESFNEDRKFIEQFYNIILLNFEDLFSYLEESSIYWNDDIDFVMSMVIKTLRKIKPTSTENMPLLPQYRDMEDKDFAKDLLRKAILNHDETKKIIEAHLKNWDIERIAYMDILIMEMAVTEFLEFVSIPTKVSLNEYIELSKSYSTQRSSVFINGILDKILKDLRKNDKIKKAGRGLVGEK
ncbi:transcription antitermination factor NusB [Puteibacter caeruleilacunae]|nr:transcription antitermination factor NusB [Puteibacter caeruleilacunae]